LLLVVSGYWAEKLRKLQIILPLSKKPGLLQGGHVQYPVRLSGSFIRTRFFVYLWLHIISDLFQSPIGIQGPMTSCRMRPRKSSVPCRVQMCVSAPVVMNQPSEGSRHGQIRSARSAYHGFNF